MFCPMCKSKEIKTLKKYLPSYVESIDVDILQCLECKTNFIDPSLATEELYNLVYSDSDTQGYDRYYKTANTIKSKTEPLKYLGG